MLKDAIGLCEDDDVLPPNNPTPSELIRWRQTRNLLRLVAEAAQGSAYTRSQARSDLDRKTAEILGRGYVAGTNWAQVLTEAVIAASEGIATPLDERDPPAEAIIAWREWVCRGGSVRSLGYYLSGSKKLVQEWRAPERTVRERMWLSNDRPPSKQLTAAAWPGIQRVLICCEDALGVTLPASLPPTPPATKVSGAYPVPGDRSAFVCDVTVPDGTEFDQGEEFVKTWRIRNSGNVRWEGRLLARQGGAAGPGSHSSPERVPIPDAESGETVDISVPMRAALLPGTSASTWKMTDDAGVTFFPDRYRFGLRCEIITRGSN